MDEYMSGDVLGGVSQQEIQSIALDTGYGYGYGYGCRSSMR